MKKLLILIAAVSFTSQILSTHACRCKNKSDSTINADNQCFLFHNGSAWDGTWQTYPHGIEFGCTDKKTEQVNCELRCAFSGGWKDQQIRTLEERKIRSAYSR
jgi:hypothetical protein